jgi:hypothetical protein
MSPSVPAVPAEVAATVASILLETGAVLIRPDAPSMSIVAS